MIREAIQTALAKMGNLVPPNGGYFRDTEAAYSAGYRHGVQRAREVLSQELLDAFDTKPEPPPAGGWQELPEVWHDPR